MKQRIIILFLACSCFLDLKAQETFIPYGKITFEKKVNMIRSLENSGLPEEAKEKMQKYSSSNWEFFFDQKKSIYKPTKKEAEDSHAGIFSFWMSKPSNEIYTDYSKNRRILKRTVMDDDYLLTDTIPLVNWKIMHDVRNIAGYDCRKAIGVIYDTVYVVAFYTDEILLPGGPEGFGGLPGTILGLAIPRYNTTWFATKIEGFANHQAEIIPPTKGKKIETDKDLKKLIELFTRYDQQKKEKEEEAKKRLYGFTL
ncbi:MAG: GLPGLI family protein [Candidatus Pedobacter colombiensis]|uniref:GLPGLI family protein n=1 Tax=Candidatus Pedobacter colombiensis TaxID=3121371 RepID=A0AAJ5WBG6_9SPHI|nr:GLPGLI family protein [Pedobacter sp.]WEK20953.1 MAG: GLPGLI family protein [Pedobacter sp.]